MKKLVTGCFGNIYYATILKNGIISDKDRVEVTDAALVSVLYHLTSMKGFEKKGYSGYTYPMRNSNKETTLCAYDKSKYVCMSKEEYEKLLEIKRMYDDLCKQG